MASRTVSAAVCLLLVCGALRAQTPAPDAGTVPGWKSAAQADASVIRPSPGAPTAAPASAPAAAPAPAVSASLPAPSVHVTSGTGQLPNEHGQLWREYDLSSYTLRITNTRRPEQAIVDWILRETGSAAWTGETLAILNATPKTLRVYHTPPVQNVVAEIVERFVRNDPEPQSFGLRLITVDSPSWRARVQRLLMPVQTQTPGVQAWLLEKEGAAMLLADLRRRGDFREHNAPELSVSNGQATVVSAVRGRNYLREVALRPDTWPGFEPQSAVVDEGFSLEFSPLLSADGRLIDAAIKCEIDQIEKLVPVMLDVPTAAAPRQQTKVEVPQVAQFRFHERFRWPCHQVLLIGLGVVAMPVPSDPKGPIPGLSLPVLSAPARADLLLLIECRGKPPRSVQFSQGQPTSPLGATR